MIRTNRLLIRSFLALGLAVVGDSLQAQMTSEADTAAWEINTDLTVRGNGLLQKRQDGLSAEMHFKDDYGSGTVTVFTSGDSSWLVYGRWKGDPTSRSCTDTYDPDGNLVSYCVYLRRIYDSAWGHVTSGFTVTPTHARLLITLGPISSNRRCVTDFSASTPVTSCTQGPPIVFDLVWTGDFNPAANYGDATEQNFGGFTFRTSGSLSGLSAVVNGHIDGRTIQTTGVLGDARSGNVTREIIATP